MTAVACCAVCSREFTPRGPRTALACGECRRLDEIAADVVGGRPVVPYRAEIASLLAAIRRGGGKPALSWLIE